VGRDGVGAGLDGVTDGVGRDGVGVVVGRDGVPKEPAAGPGGLVGVSGFTAGLEVVGAAVGGLVTGGLVGGAVGLISG
jgi:hypothetical protein